MNFQSLGEQQLFFLMLSGTTLSKKSNWHNSPMVWLDMFMTLGCFSFSGTFANSILDFHATRYLQNGDCRKMLVARQGGQAGHRPLKTKTLRTWQVNFFVASLFMAQVNWLTHFRVVSSVSSTLPRFQRIVCWAKILWYLCNSLV